jgi:hypothetical protein
VAADGQQEQKVGAKVTCAACGTTIVIVKAPTTPIECCGAPIGSLANASTTKEATGG